MILRKCTDADFTKFVHHPRHAIRLRPTVVRRRFNFLVRHGKDPEKIMVQAWKPILNGHVQVVNYMFLHLFRFVFDYLKAVSDKVLAGQLTRDFHEQIALLQTIY